MGPHCLTLVPPPAGPHVVRPKGALWHSDPGEGVPLCSETLPAARSRARAGWLQHQERARAWRTDTRASKASPWPLCEHHRSHCKVAVSSQGRLAPQPSLQSPQET